MIGNSASFSNSEYFNFITTNIQVLYSIESNYFSADLIAFYIISWLYSDTDCMWDVLETYCVILFCYMAYFVIL